MSDHKSVDTLFKEMFKVSSAQSTAQSSQIAKSYENTMKNMESLTQRSSPPNTVTESKKSE